LFAVRTATPMNTVEIQPIPTHVFVSRNPSGICTEKPFFVVFLFDHSRIKKKFTVNI